jgi:hypothetical protein
MALLRRVAAGGGSGQLLLASASRRWLSGLDEGYNQLHKHRSGERPYADRHAAPAAVSYRAVAVFCSPFKERHGTPRQPGGAAAGCIQLLPLPDARAADMLDELAGLDDGRAVTLG